MGEHLVSTLALSVFIGSSLFLQVHVRRTTIIPQSECQKRISNVKIRYSVPIKIPKKVFPMSKYDIRPQLECQNRTSNVKVRYSIPVRMST